MSHWNKILDIFRKNRERIEDLLNQFILDTRHSGIYLGLLSTGQLLSGFNVVEDGEVQDIVYSIIDRFQHEIPSSNELTLLERYFYWEIHIHARSIAVCSNSDHLLIIINMADLKTNYKEDARRIGYQLQQIFEEETD